MNAATPHTEVFLQPGEYYFGGAGERLRTVLGSCVAIVLWHPARKMGGMCHFLLPRRRDRADELDGRYGEEAILLLSKDIARSGTSLREYQAKLFGGGRMFDGIAVGAHFDVGARNAEIARALLRRAGVAVLAEDLEGRGHRSVLFDLATGEVKLRSGLAMVSGAMNTAQPTRDHCGLIEWQAGMETGLTHIDTQHRHLLQLFNLLSRRAGKGLPGGELQNLLAEFDACAQMHFASEESVLRQCGAPEEVLARYGIACEAYRACVASLTEPPRSDQALAPERILGLIGRWWQLHFADARRDLARRATAEGLDYAR